MSIEDLEKLNIDERIKSDKKAIERLKKAYNDALKEIEKDIMGFYARYGYNNDMSIAEAKKQADSFDVQNFMDKAKQYVENKDFSNKANAELELYNLTMKVNRLDLLKLQLGMELANLDSEVEKIMTDYVTAEEYAEMKRQTGILEQLKLTKYDAEAIAKRNILGKTFSPRLWLGRDKLAYETDKLVTQAVVLGKHPTKLVSDLKKKFDTSRYNAQRVLLTETAKAQMEGMLDNFKDTGVDYYTIVGELDACPHCKRFFDIKFAVKDFDLTVTSPPFHPNCRCSMRPWTDEDSLNILTDEELGALKKYASSESYSVNDTLRNGHDTSYYDELIKNVDKGLSKLPVYNNISPLNRDLFFKEDIKNKFVKDHPVGSKLNDKAYKSFSKGDYGQGTQAVRLVLPENKTGKDMLGISPKEEQEVLFARDAEFIIKSIVDKGNYVEMEIEEI